MLNQGPGGYEPVSDMDVLEFDITATKHINDLVNDCSISWVLAMEILWSCTKP